MLIHRVASDDMAWQKDVVSFAPQVSSQVDLTLDDKQVLRSIQQLNFIQMKRKYLKIVIFCLVGGFRKVLEAKFTLGKGLLHGFGQC